ncbi:hypothetical protein KCU91_g4747, partial [Aureobasidium melanogenum]
MPEEEIAYAQHSQEFMQIMKGVDLALMEMENFGHQSKLRSLTQHSSKRIKLETGDTEHAPYPENNSVELACSTLRELQKQVGDEPELVRGTKELINFMQNLRKGVGSNPTLVNISFAHGMCVSYLQMMLL